MPDAKITAATVARNSMVTASISRSVSMRWASVHLPGARVIRCEMVMAFWNAERTNPQLAQNTTPP